MSVKETVETALGIKLLEDMGTLLPRSVTAECYGVEPGVTGDGCVQGETEYWKIMLVYSNREKLERDAKILKRKLQEADGYSLPSIEYDNEPDHKKWKATIHVEKIGG